MLTVDSVSKLKKPKVQKKHIICHSHSTNPSHEICSLSMSSKKSSKWNRRTLTFGKYIIITQREPLVWHVMPRRERENQAGFYPLYIALNVFDAWTCRQSLLPPARGQHWTSIIASLHVSCSLKRALCTHTNLPWGFISITIYSDMKNVWSNITKPIVPIANYSFFVYLHCELLLNLQLSNLAVSEPNNVSFLTFQLSQMKDRLNFCTSEKEQL